MILLQLATLLTVFQSARTPIIGTLIVAHGGDSSWNASVDSVAKSVRLTGPVGVSFLMGQGASTHRFQDVARSLARRGAERIVVVPLFVSSHSGHYEQLRYLVGQTDTLDAEMRHHLEMAGISSAPELSFQLLTAIDDAPEIAQILTSRASVLSPDSQDHAVLLIGHGPNSAEDYAAWMTSLRTIADSMVSLGGFRHVAVELLRDDAPDEVRREAASRIRELVSLEYAATNRPVIVVPVLIARGTITSQALPQVLSGLPVIYAGQPLAPDPGVARWIERKVLGASEAPGTR